LLINIGFEWDLNRKQSTSSHNGRNKDLASYTKESSDVRVPQQFTDIHLLDADLKDKEEIITRNQTAETSCGKIKVLEFSC